MNRQFNVSTETPERQLAIQAKCFHPTGTFIEFQKDEIEQSIPDRFEAQVRMHSNRLAVKTRSHQLTYEELNKAANQVAAAILDQRGEGEEPIALLFEHGTSAIAAILGVLKAGKCYVALDSANPRARNSYMLEDSRAGAIVTNNSNLSLARELAHNGCQLINIDELESSLSRENPALAIPSTGLAVVIYTSASTGNAKGVLQTHRNVLRKSGMYINLVHICPDDRHTLLVSLSFAMALDMFAALLKGAALFPLDIKVEGIGNLASWLKQEEITIYRSVPTVFRHFVGTLTEDEKIPMLRSMGLCGEPVIKQDVELYKMHFSLDCVFINMLGSAELPGSRNYMVDHQTEITSSVVPAGYAVEGVDILIVDDAGNTVGFECVGEIVIRSQYLSPGYWRRPDLTRAVFLPDPEGGDQAIYRTGDLGRLLPDGNLEHLGRKDSQLKIRGYRVEVAEIEMAMLGIDAIGEAVVVSREDRPGGQRLVAYVVPSSQTSVTVTAMRSSLQGRLPDYMVPSAFVVLDAMPTLPTGKVDRRALPPPDSSRPQLDNDIVDPRTPVEERMVEVWAEVLGLDQVGIHDNFLELGGDSLLASQVISRVIKTFRVELPLRSLFEAPTVAEMALTITENQANKAEQADIERLLTELEALSAEEAKRLLAS